MQFRCFDKLTAREALAFGRQSFDDLDIILAVLEERAEQIVLLFAKFADRGEDEAVNILRHTFFLVHQRKIIRNSAKDHVIVGNLAVRIAEAVTLEIFATFAQCEWLDQHLVSHAVVKSSVVVDEVVEHPRCRTATRDELDVASRRCPMVPEMLEGTQEIRLCRSQPWQLVEKQYLALGCDCLKVSFKLVECLQPPCASFCAIIDFAET